MVRDDYLTPWSKIDCDELLALHMVDTRHAPAAFREAAERRRDSSKQTHQSDRLAAAQSEKQLRPSVCREPRTPARKRRRFRQTHCRQVAPHYLTGDDRLHRPQRNYEAIHISQYGGCTVLFNKDTFYSEVEASSIYWPDTRREERDRAAERGQGFFMSGVLARATFKNGKQPMARNTSLCWACTSATYLQRSEASPRSSSSRCGLLVISMERHGEVPENTTPTKVRLKRHFRTLTCPRRQAPHHCRGLDLSLIYGPTCADSTNHQNLIESGKFASMEPWPSHVKHWAFAIRVGAVTT